MLKIYSKIITLKILKFYIKFQIYYVKILEWVYPKYCMGYTYAKNYSKITMLNF